MEDLDIPGVANFEFCYRFFSLLKYQYSFDRLIDIVVSTYQLAKRVFQYFEKMSRGKSLIRIIIIL